MTSQPPSDQPALQAPWRLGYLDAMDKKEKSSGPPHATSGSFLRDYWLAPQDDFKNHVIVRAPDGLILLNAYPYSNGHLLVALGEPAPRLLDYTPAKRARLFELVSLGAELLYAALEPQGINVGMNEGRAAGAGVPQHLHAHLVPRWHGDVNFMAVVGNVRVIPSSLDAMAARFREAWHLLQARPSP